MELLNCPLNLFFYLNAAVRLEKLMQNNKEIDNSDISVIWKMFNGRVVKLKFGFFVVETE